jgi:hypothetical protein
LAVVCCLMPIGWWLVAIVYVLLGKAERSVVSSFEVLNGTACVLRERITPWHMLGAVVLPTGDRSRQPSEWLTAVVFDAIQSQQQVCLRPHYRPVGGPAGPPYSPRCR